MDDKHEWREMWIFVKDKKGIEEKNSLTLKIEIKCKIQHKMDMIIIATHCTKFWI